MVALRSDSQMAVCCFQDAVYEPDDFSTSLGPLVTHHSRHYRKVCEQSIAWPTLASPSALSCIQE